jgi:hypothetical protein
MPGQETAEMTFASEIGSLEFDIRVNAEFYEKGKVAADHVPAIEASVQAVVSRLFSDGNRALQSLAIRYPSEGYPGIESILSLPQPSFTLLGLDVWLRKALDGETGEVELGRWQFEYPASPMRLVCQSVEFKEGSLNSWLKGFAEGAGLVVALAGTPQLVNAYNDHRLTQTLSQTYGSQECVSSGTITVRADALYAISSPQFNYKAPGLSDDEKRIRVCYVQLATSVDGIDTGPVDGDPRTRTDRGLQQFQKKHNLQSHDVTDAAVQIELTKAMKRGLDELKK